MKIATISDIHGRWEGINYPPADILVFAGDILRNYNSNRMLDAHQQLGELEKLNAFLEQLVDFKTYSHIVFCAGNHDFCFERLPAESIKRLGKHITYLENSEATIQGVKFYGSPNQPWYYDWAFNFPDHNANFFRAKAHAQRCWANIPDDTQVLITHGPPRDILDECLTGERVGCPWLGERVLDLAKLKLHIFGHIHASYGVVDRGNVKFVNTAICKEKWAGFNPVPVFEISAP